ncbi:MAG TPA: dihydroorotase [Nitrospira sp.]|nr:dihydroorotase [Nitrospira sp.]HNK13670.1 dihydroorotase [Nitrospira sp.]
MILIYGGWIVAPGSRATEADLLIAEGVVVGVEPHLGARIDVRHAECIDARGVLVMPGFVDLHVHLREPGYEHKETIATGTAAAVAGGFTTVCCMPNTKPVNDDIAVTGWIIERARATASAHVHPIGAMTMGSAGRELADFRALKQAGCVAVSDDGRPVMRDEVMRRVMQSAAELDLPVIDHCEDTMASGCGCMNEGPVSRAMGWRGMPGDAEYRMIARDIRLARETGARLHIAHLSTADGVEMVRKAKSDGVRITAEVSPHHFTLTDDAVSTYGANAKMNPPLRAERDRTAVVEGLADGAIDAIATDHAPHAEYEKERGMNRAPFGIVGLETALGLTLRLVQQGRLTLERAITCLTSAPAAVLGLPKGILKPGAAADITLINPDVSWTVDPGRFRSKSRNTPFSGWTLKGQVIRTLVAGKTVYQGPDAE